MKHISELATASMKSTPESKRAPDLSRASKVWAQLAEMFGKGFYRDHGEQPGNLWVQAIERLTDRQLANGLAELGNAGLSYPPNLSQFIAACKKPKPIAPWRQLPAPDYDREREADKAWKEMERLAGRKLERDKCRK